MKTEFDKEIDLFYSLKAREGKQIQNFSSLCELDLIKSFYRQRS